MVVTRVRAQTNDAPVSIPGARAGIENREARRATLMTNIQERVINLSSNVTKRLDAGVSRLNNISDRIKTRIEKLKSQNIDTSAAETKLDEAQKKLDEAEGRLLVIGSVADAISSDTPHEKFASIRGEFMKIRDLLKEAQVLLKETVSLLKSAVSAAGLDRGVSSAVSEGQPVATPQTAQ